MMLLSMRVMTYCIYRIKRQLFEGPSTKPKKFIFKKTKKPHNGIKQPTTGCLTVAEDTLFLLFMDWFTEEILHNELIHSNLDALLSIAPQHVRRASVYGTFHPQDYSCRAVSCRDCHLSHSSVHLSRRPTISSSLLETTYVVPLL